MQPAFVPSTPAPTHFGAFRQSGALGIYDLRGVSLLVPEISATSRIIVEAAFGADVNANASSWTWTDITANVMFNPGITIGQGRADETSQAQPASCTFNLDNTTAAYSAFNPAGAHYPYVRRSTPIRVSVDPGSGVADVQFQGEAASWTPTWDTSAKLAIVQVVAAGSLRRLTQGKTPLRSPLFRSISTLAPYAYWTMEDGSGATQAVAAAGGVPMVVSSGTATFGADGGPGSAASIDFSGGLIMSGQIAPISPSPMSWRLAVAFKWDAATTAGLNANICSITTSTGATWYLQATSGATWTINVLYNPPGGGTTFIRNFTASTWTPATMDSWKIVEFTFVQNGAGVDVGGHFGSLSGFGVSTGFFTPITLGYPTLVQPGNTYLGIAPDTMAVRMAHVAFASPTVAAPSIAAPDLASAVIGYTGETASARAARVSAEQNVPLTLTGTSTTAMGPQPIAAYVDILRECETADGGVLYDGFSQGLGYICRTSRYNLAPAITLNAANGEVGIPFAPVDDDQRNRNDVTVSRSTGTSARVVDSTGPLGTGQIGVYDTSVTVNTSTDLPLAQIAGWQVHLGTVEGLRYPNAAIDFAATPGKVPDWLAAPPISFRADVTNASQKATQHPPDDVQLMVEGYTQTINPRSWKVTANCSRYSPWQVAVFDSARYDSATSTLALPAPAGSGTLSVLVGDGTLWVTGAVNFDINVGGVRFTVSNIAGSTTPQTFTIGAPVNGVVKDLPAGTKVRLWNTPTYAL